MRERRKGQRRLATALRGYEATGDAALERFAYIEAVAQYEQALTQSQAPEDEVRLCEKIGSSISYGVRPHLAISWFERALERCETTDSLRWKVPKILIHFPYVYWLASRTVEGIPYLTRARDYLDDTLGVAYHSTLENYTLEQRINSLAANYLLLLGRYREAATFLAVYEPSTTPDLAARAFSLCASLRAIEGKAEETFSNFDRAINIARKIQNGYQLTVHWDDYANCAMALGRLDIARACRERALLVARERRLAWRIPYLTLRFASLLITASDYRHAYDLVYDAMSYDTETPVIRVLKTMVAVELANAIGDTELLQRTHDDETLEYAFRSGEQQLIGTLTAVYVKVAISRGQLSLARKLIARAMALVDRAEGIGDLLVLAARYGSSQDGARAHQLLLRRMRLPHHRVTKAYLDWWEAQNAMRTHATDKAKEYAERAARGFGRLGWKHQQSEALALAGKPRAVAVPPQHTPMLTELTKVLTPREQQVAELVLRGLANRNISEVLSISEHTVEAHMTSILNRLGLRSRWQLRDLAQE